MRYDAGVLLLALESTLAGTVAGVSVLQCVYPRLQKNVELRSSSGLARQPRFMRSLYERVRILGLVGVAFPVIGIALFEMSHHWARPLGETGKR